MRRLVELKHWAKSMKLGEGRVTFHVLEAVSPAGALLDYANANNVDHIVLGARTNSTMRNLLGSVSAEVARQCALHRHRGSPAASGARPHCDDAGDLAGHGGIKNFPGKTARLIQYLIRRKSFTSRNADDIYV